MISYKTLTWSDEQTRFYLQLRIEEKEKGNIRLQNANDTGRKTIIEKFHERFGERHEWKKFGSKLTTCKKQFEAYKRLVHNKTGLGYFPDGSLNMSEDWWAERIKEWPGAEKLKDKPLLNLDLMERVFSTAHVSGAEGWSAQQGEEHLNAMQLDRELGADCVDVQSTRIPPTQATETDADAKTDAESTQNLPATLRPSASNIVIGNNGPSSSHGNGLSYSTRSSRKKRSRSVQGGQDVAEVIRDSVKSRDKILAHKNQLIENHPEFSCSQLRAMEVLHSLPAIKMWSPLYKATIKHLKQDITNRQTFLFYEDDENKIIYLEVETGESRDG
ncbi:unnamed protein product [Microthlaspi erraticum]|uniref:Myb/SANT-like domain-containing protein n=1 Tax=Microthlaspi erraticum TaxID=1685480 RepID=A0A6D2ITA2_9BRAS|nr:unnamed protein product [Microthlaspi erraticum]